jgi:hypothetical protein
MPKIVASKSVTKVLLPDEEVISRMDTADIDFYATSKRVLAFKKPAWLLIFLFIGVFPYLIIHSLAGKTSLAGGTEYSQISGVNL